MGVGGRILGGWTRRLWRAGTEPKQEREEARGGSGSKVCAAAIVDSCGEGSGD